MMKSATALPARPAASASETAPVGRARFTGLDGLRAIAVLLVLAYHLFPGWILQSGFVGVDVFLVISGFLITSLLLRERHRTGSIALVGFWRRRARRLLPALALVVTVTATWAWIIGGDVLVRLGWQVLGAATFSYNWVSVAGSADYFTADTPELLRNLWSLAVEEQFYALWPLLFLLVMLIPNRWVRTAIAIAGAAASAWWMSTLVGSGLTRAYFGTDSHAFGLLLGVALAFGLQRVVTSDAAWLRHPVTRRAGTAVGVVAIVGLVVTAALPEHADASTFPGTLLLAVGLSGLLIAVAVVPASRIGGALDTPVLRWIGDRSYGIYLWHWPLFVLIVAMTGTSAASESLPPWVGPVVFVLTLVIAALSYRLV
jgi:peptidoglycan/LPS O-acetylase OafA/YrhL